MKLRALVVSLALLALSTAASTGQNLLTNGDFETSALFPWQVTAGAVTIVPGVPSGFRASASNGTISQTIETEIGAAYRISFQRAGGGSLGSFTVSATPTGGAQPDGTKTISNIGGISNIPSFNFVASSASTIISARISASEIGQSAVGFLDDLEVIELKQTPLVGRYKGTFTKQLLLPDLSLSQKVTEKLVAVVDDIGRIVILRDAVEVAAGQIFADGQFSIRFGDRLETGTAVLKGKRIEIGFTIAGDARDDVDELIPTETKLSYVLTRLAPLPPR